MYDYPAVLDALASRGATVISARRRANTDVAEYAGVVVAQVERLIHLGVPASRIVVVGFSKGGDIAIHVMSCGPYNRHAERPRTFEEIRISTGHSHGAFYLPRDAWLAPTLAWIHQP